jgi:hypothetical protein
MKKIPVTQAMQILQKMLLCQNKNDFFFEPFQGITNKLDVFFLK